MQTPEVPPSEVRAIDADVIRRWYVTAAEALHAARDEIDALNVYPVPDGDTGTNMALTMQAVAEAVRGTGDDLAATLSAGARGALMGARGNSGVILSQLLQGIADVLGPHPAPAGEQLQDALGRAADLAYGAVAEPVEGTILSVARAAADAARAGETSDLDTVARAAERAAEEALQRTTGQLDALQEAGVVDAGGRGLVVVLAALVDTLSDEPAARQAAARSTVSHPPPIVDRHALAAAREQGSDEFAYEVQFLLDADDEAIGPLRARLSSLGDSLVVVGGGGLHNVHVHVNDVGAAMEAAVQAGRPHRISVTRFEDQYADHRAVPSAGVAIVAVAPGTGLRQLFESEGALVVAGGPTDNPSTADLLDAIRRSGAGSVVVLPNDHNVKPVADAAAEIARGEGCRVSVLPTRSPVQGLAALAVHDPERRFDEDVIAMTSAAGATRWAEVTHAVRAAHTTAGICQPGDVLGLVDGDVVTIGRDVFAVGADVLHRLLTGGGELVTIVRGADTDVQLAERLAENARATHPGIEMTLYDGGQPHYPLLLGVE